MDHRGKVMNGHIVLDAEVRLPEGSAVEVSLCEEQTQDTGQPGGQTLFELLEPFVGTVNDLPSDMSTNHDHYLYGAPKRP